MQKSKEQLLKRKAEIIDFLTRHGKMDPKMKDNFISEFPNYSEFSGATDESEEAHEVADYELALAREQAMERELEEVNEQLTALE